MHVTGLPWQDMPFFLALARAGTFKAAADVLKKDRTTLARRLARVEAHLGTQLFDRTENGLVLTPQGKRVLEIAELAEQELSALGSNPGVAAGQDVVRIAISDHLLAALAPALERFSQSHPSYVLDFVVSDVHADLTRFEADIAVRMSRDAAPGLLSTPAGRPTFSLYAPVAAELDALGYIARPGETRPPAEARTRAPNLSVVARANGVLAAMHLVKAGLGCAVLPDYLGRAELQVTALIPIRAHANPQFHIICRSEQRRLRRIQAVAQAFSRALADLDTVVDHPS